jgi:glycosyltransferase involved in cell wall biosynthesis
VLQAKNSFIYVRSDIRCLSVVTRNMKNDSCELSIVMPCLNEADTLSTCIRKAQEGILAAGVDAEIIIADNGSTDESVRIAESHGAKVVRVPQRPFKHHNGYGRGLMTGIAAARGTYILMGDSDDSYDFGEIPRFLSKLREGYDLVQGCRLPSGGGIIKPGAMPVLHRLVGNPFFSWLIRLLFGTTVRDVNCGMRAFRKDWFDKMDHRCAGMEFASEMIIKSALFKASVVEIPITLHPDGRKKHKPHLRTFRDGWRVVRLLFLYSPAWLFLYPGTLMVMLGLVGYALALPGVQVGEAIFDAATLLFSSAFILCGYQAVLYSILAKTYGMNEGLMPPQPALIRFYSLVDMERVLLAGVLCLLCGLGLASWALHTWASMEFGRMNYPDSMRIVIPAAMFIVLGFQTICAGFFTSILGLGETK